MKTFWALTVIPTKQQVGSKIHKLSTSVENKTIPEMVKPMYETESAVTTAIAAGTKQVDPNYPTECPYVVAKRWQKHLKDLASLQFKLRKKAGTANRNGLCNHTFQFGR